jgi:hypothetical protein
VGVSPNILPTSLLTAHHSHVSTPYLACIIFDEYTYCNEFVQAFTTHWHGSYCTYDKFCFRHGEYRKDHDEIWDKIANAIVEVEALKLGLSEALTPTSPRVLPQGFLKMGTLPTS